MHVVPIVGGIAPQKQERLLSYRPPIVVATPGRLWQLITEASSPHLADLSSIKFLVIDEVDRYVSQEDLKNKIIEDHPSRSAAIKKPVLVSC